MEHKQYKQIIHGAKTAVLFIHGIAGSPNHFEPFLPLIPDTISVYNLLLDGHGRSAKDFAHASMKKWESQVQRAVEELAQTHEAIYIAAHSMGTLFAIEQAIKHKKVTNLFLLAVPIRLSLKPKALTNSLNIYRGRIRLDDPAAMAAKNCYGIAPDKNLLHYLGWIPRYLELLSKIRQTRRMLPALDTPCAVYQSGEDELVSICSVQYLARSSKISVAVLAHAGHYYYEKKDLEFLLKEFARFIRTSAAK